MKVALIRPNANNQYQSLNEVRAIEPPLWLALMANLYKDVIILDGEAGLKDTDIFDIVNKNKIEKVVILATGNHPSAFIQQRDRALELKNYLDLIPSVKYIDVYDYLPFNPLEVRKPRWDLLDISKYRCHNWQSWANKDKNKSYGVVFTSISCPYHCSFCTIHRFYKQGYAVRKVDDVINDFYDLYNLGVRNFKIMDELFITKAKRTFDILNRLQDIGKDINIWTYARIDTVNEELLKAMKKAGIKWVAYGIESGSDYIRQQVMKGSFDKDKIREVIKMTKDNGIYIVGNYMFGFWEDNYDTMRETLDFAKELNTEYANFYCLTVYPGTKLYEFYKEKGIDLPTKSEEYAQFSPNFKPLDTKYLKGTEVLKFRDQAFKEYFANVKYWAMIQEKFGIDVVNEIAKLANIEIERKN